MAIDREHDFQASNFGVASVQTNPQGLGSGTYLNTGMCG